MNHKLEIWLRVIRFKFLAASAIAVTNGLALSYLYKPDTFNIFYAILIYIGIFCLHSSVDLFNDYWDFKRGIDQITKKTKFSGGTGVLPEGLLEPGEVYWAGILFLILGLLIGLVFVFLKGYLIAFILGFATLSIILYSSKLVNVGLGELFVGVKGVLIVIGSFYVQTSTINLESLFVGAIIGLLSSLVLYVNSIPDIAADKLKGRKTLAILLEYHSPSKIFIFILGLFVLIYLLTFISYHVMMNNIYSFVPSIFLVPLAISILYRFHNYIFNANEVDSSYEKIMEKTVIFSRIYGLSVVIGILLLFINNYKK